MANNNNGNTSTLIIFYRNLSHLHTKGLKNWVFCFFSVFFGTHAHIQKCHHFFCIRNNRTEQKSQGHLIFFLLFIHTITIANNFIRFSIKKIDHPFFHFGIFFPLFYPNFSMKMMKQKIHRSIVTVKIQYTWTGHKIKMWTIEILFYVHHFIIICFYNNRRSVHK